MSKIPKTIHYCWFGRGEKPDDVKKNIVVWKNMHPDFEIKEWNEDNFNIDEFPYAKQAYDNKRFAFVTDIVRLHALHTEGGIYMDTDVEVIKPLDIFLKHTAFTGCETEEMCVTGTMGSVAGGRWVRTLLDYYDGRNFIVSNAADLTTNTQSITSITVDEFGWIPGDNNQDLGVVMIYSSDYFCAKSYLTGAITTTQNTHTIHHFKGSWKTTKERNKSLFMNKMKRLIISVFGKDNFEKINKVIRGK